MLSKLLAALLPYIVEQKDDALKFVQYYTAIRGMPTDIEGAWKLAVFTIKWVVEKGTPTSKKEVGDWLKSNPL